MATEAPTLETEEQKNLAEAKKNLAEAKRKYAEAKKKALLQRKSDSLDDADLLQKSRVWHALFLNHLLAFSAFDASLDNTYANTWLNKIEEFERLNTDETMLDLLQEDTEKLAVKIQLLLDQIDDLEYFARRAFPNNERKMMEFSFSSFSKEVPNHVGHLALLSLTAIRVTAFYTAGLTAAGMPTTLPTQIEDAVSAMVLAETQQEYTKRVRIRTATERIIRFNDLWDIHIAVRNAAKIVFRTQTVIARQFE